MDKKISYLNRTFEDYKTSLMGFTRKYYPDIADDMNDASVGNWLIDLAANVADNLSYHVDRVFQETNINSAQEKNSIYTIARNNGIKIPGPKSSVAEIEITCILPAKKSDTETDLMPDWNYAPIIYNGTKVSSATQVFELLYDVDFAEQFNHNGISNRTIEKRTNPNGIIQDYIIKKTAIVIAGESKIFKKEISENDIKPFMSIIVPSENAMCVESVILKDGIDYTTIPTNNEFNNAEEYFETVNECGTGSVKCNRFFEVNSLAEQYRWGEVTDNNGKVTVVSNLQFPNQEYSAYYNVKPVPSDNGMSNYFITKGEWKPLLHKFVTEFTDSGYLKIIFGAGYENGIKNISEKEKNTEKYYMSVIMNNDSLGVLPESGHTMFIKYRVGGGVASNVPSGSISNISYLNAQFRGDDNNVKSSIRNSISVTNPIPSLSGKDMMGTEELKNYIKYNKGSQERCVTVKDYHDRILRMPSKYGTPYKVGVTEENNKIMAYVLNCDNNGKLTSQLPKVLVDNISEYLSEYRMINDYVEIKSGRIINLAFEIDFYYSNGYNPSDVSKQIIELIKKYMSVENHQMGDDIFVGDIEKEISKLDGVQNLIEVRVYNMYGQKDKNHVYSNDRTMQQIKSPYDCFGEEYTGGPEANRDLIDLMASDKTLFSENDTMLEVKYDDDIKVRPKSR